MTDNSTVHVALLKGGISSERKVSLASGRAVEEALHTLGYRVSVVDVARDVGAVLTGLKPDIVFNALHGRYGEDGAVQGLLELLDIPYTHSGVLASSVAMHKVRSKEIFAKHGLRCPAGGEFSVADIMNDTITVGFPYVVKPVADGSSVNVFIVRNADDLAPLRLLDDAMTFLVEPYIPGREIQVAVLDGKALGAIEIQPDGEFYDYEAKYSEGKATHVMPAPLGDDDYAEVLTLAEKAHDALGCRGLTRSDFRFNDTDIGQSLFYLLEINTQPGMTELSLAPEIAAHAGTDFTALVDYLVQHAVTDGGTRYG